MVELSRAALRPSSLACLLAEGRAIFLCFPPHLAGREAQAQSSREGRAHRCSVGRNTAELLRSTQMQCLCVCVYVYGYVYV